MAEIRSIRFLDKVFTRSARSAPVTLALRGVLVAAVAVAAVVFMAPDALHAQAQGRAAAQGRQGQGQGRGARGPSDWPPAGPTPHTADGHVDLSGNWQPNAIRQNVDLVKSGVMVPFRPEAQKIWQEHKDNLSKDDPESRCLPPGVPRMNTTPYPWSYIQTPKLLVIVYEGGAHVWRKVFLDGRAHDPNTVDTWLGDSIGHWDGDTLVVETVGQNDKTWLDEAGVPHSSDMKVTERISRPDLGHLTIENIIDDPKTFTSTWSFTTHPSLLKGELIEYICQENNRDVEHLYGK
jgi:hypothetical protein